MSNSEPFEQRVERMNTEVVRKKRVRADFFSIIITLYMDSLVTKYTKNKSK